MFSSKNISIFIQTLNYARLDEAHVAGYFYFYIIGGDENISEGLDFDGTVRAINADIKARFPELDKKTKDRIDFLRLTLGIIGSLRTKRVQVRLLVTLFLAATMEGYPKNIIRRIVVELFERYSFDHSKQTHLGIDDLAECIENHGKFINSVEPKVFADAVEIDSLPSVDLRTIVGYVFDPEHNTFLPMEIAQKFPNAADLTFMSKVVRELIMVGASILARVISLVSAFLAVLKENKKKL